MMRVARPGCSFLAIALLAAGTPARAQTAPGSSPPPAGQALRLFLDCNFCDTDFLRTEITFVDYMRDRTDADVHVLVTTQGTGGGGTDWTLKFIGLGRFAGMEDTLHYLSSRDDTDDVERRGFARYLKLGLMRFVAQTPLAERLQITMPEGSAAQGAAARPVRDPWNFWVFRTSMNGFSNGERSSGFFDFWGTFSANRTTEQWKIHSAIEGSYSKSRFELDEGETFTTIRRDYAFNALVVKSLGPRWSVGARASASSSTFLNQRLAIRLAPAIEFDIFPYAEFTRRRLTIQYSIGTDSFDYQEETIFSKMSETLTDQTLTVSLGLKQPWGSLNTSFDALQYIEDFKKHRLRVSGSTSVRLFKGFSFNVGGNVQRLRDQIYLPKGEATAEEILVRQRQLLTGYRYFMNFGVSYSFGSIYNNVVNPRIETIFF
jgi:hypothetical protein